MAPSPSPISSRLETPRLVLRCPNGDDGPSVNAALRESWPELQRWMDWAQGDPPSVEETTRRLTARPAGFDTREDLSFALFERATNRFVGMASLFRFDWSVPRGEIGYWLRTSAAGQGYMTEAVRALTLWGFESLHLARIEIRCDAANERSKGVAVRAGYEFEGRLRHECRTPQGALRTTIVFARFLA